MPRRHHGLPNPRYLVLRATAVGSNVRKRLASSFSPGVFSDMIAPKNNGGNVPQISHWFLCYHTEESGSGSLKITKTVVPFAGTGTPLAPIPTTASFSSARGREDRLPRNREH